MVKFRFKFNLTVRVLWFSVLEKVLLQGEVLLVHNFRHSFNQNVRAYP